MIIFNWEYKVMRPSLMVVTRGLFLVVEVLQGMVQVAGNWDKQLVVGSNSQGLNPRKISRQIATPPQSSQELLHPRYISTVARPHQAREAYDHEATIVTLATWWSSGGRRPWDFNVPRAKMEEDVEEETQEQKARISRRTRRKQM